MGSNYDYIKQAVMNFLDAQNIHISQDSDTGRWRVEYADGNSSVLWENEVSALASALEHVEHECRVGTNMSVLCWD